MSNHESIRKLWVVMPVFIAFAFLLIIPSTAILISNNSNFGTTNLASGQPAQMNSNVTNSLNTIPLENSLPTAAARTYAQAILFGPNLGTTNENLYVPITTTGQLRVYETQTTPFTFTSVVQSGSPLVQPWYLSFRGTDPSTLAYTTAVSALSSSPSSLSSTQAPSNTQPIPSQPNFRPFQP
jgi:hypothetical protein